MRREIERELARKQTKLRKIEIIRQKFGLAHLPI